jgi:ADP-glucose pyrophosphorylase
MTTGHDRHHLDTKADVTIGVVSMPVETASQFGVVRADGDMWVVGFQEKPRKDPFTMPGDPGRILVSMGIYVFHTSTLIRRLVEDAKLKTSSHDLGKDIIPRMVRSGTVMAYSFRDIMGASYWRDIGTLDSYYEANMDLGAVPPKCTSTIHRGRCTRYTARTLPPRWCLQAGRTAGGSPGARLHNLRRSIISGGKRADHVSPT